MKKIYRYYFATKIDIFIVGLITGYWTANDWITEKTLTDKIGSIVTLWLLFYALLPVLFYYSNKFGSVIGNKLADKLSKMNQARKDKKDGSK